MATKAIILFSGGADSTVILALALSKGLECIALSFDYGQRHRCELKAAAKIAGYYKVKHQIVKIDSQTFRKSSLVDEHLQAPHHRTLEEMAANGIPNTYVPARNTLFLSYGLALSEIYEAQEIHFGPNALDGPCYPDCRPNYIAAFQLVSNSATKQAVETGGPTIVTPLISMNKEEIFKLGRALKAPLELTWSCYEPTVEEQPCGSCDACILRQPLGHRH